MQILASHGDHDVEVYLQLMRDASFNAKVMRFGARPPIAQLGDGEKSTENDESEGELAAASGALGIGGFSFSYRSKKRLAEKYAFREDRAYSSIETEDV